MSAEVVCVHEGGEREEEGEEEDRYCLFHISPFSLCSYINHRCNGLHNSCSYQVT